jgi:hypothetical protein
MAKLMASHFPAWVVVSSMGSPMLQPHQAFLKAASKKALIEIIF